MLKFIKRVINPIKDNPISSAENINDKDSNRSYTYAELETFEFSCTLVENIELINKIMQNNSDFVVKNITLGRIKSKTATIFYIDNLIDSNQIDNDILRPLVLDAYSSGLISSNEIIEQLKAGNLITRAQSKLCTNMKEFIQGLLLGQVCLIIDGSSKAYIISTSGKKARSIEESKIESVIRGPRDSFVETLDTNIGLIRKRVQSPNLVVETIKLGTETNTKICITYIKGICPSALASEVRSRLNRITIDGILESGYLEDFIQDNPFSPFPQLRNTERPDVTAAALLEGRVAIITDTTPIVLIAPGEFFSLMQSAEDYYENYIFATSVRLMRYLALLIATFLPGFYIAVTNFHKEMIPTELLTSISSARTGVPFPSIIEALGMYITFELLYEAGRRLPKSFGQTVSIVGAVVIGQAAVEANVISPLMVLVVSLTGIGTFCIPQHNIALPIRILRFVFMVLSAVLGLFGLMIGILFLLLHLTSLRSFGVAYLMPLSPMQTDSLKDTFIRAPWWAFVKRPSYITANKKRMQSGQIPLNPEDRKEKQ